MQTSGPLAATTGKLMHNIKIDSKAFDQHDIKLRAVQNGEVIKRLVAVYRWLVARYGKENLTEVSTYLLDGVAPDVQFVDLQEACYHACTVNRSVNYETTMEVTHHVELIVDDLKFVIDRQWTDITRRGYFLLSYDCYIETSDITRAVEFKLINPWFD
jgi:hypothetical protein